MLLEVDVVGHVQDLIKIGLREGTWFHNARSDSSSDFDDCRHHVTPMNWRHFLAVTAFLYAILLLLVLLI